MSFARVLAGEVLTEADELKGYDSLVESLGDVIGVDVLRFCDNWGFHVAFRHDFV